MHNTTNFHQRQVLIWFSWFFAILALFWQTPAHNGWLPNPGRDAASESEAVQLLGGVVSQGGQHGTIFPWGMRRRGGKWAIIRYRAWQKAVRKARWAARMGRLAARGAVSMAMVVDLLTRSHLQRHIGALPVLYGLLEILQVRQIINRHVPSQAQIDHGSVALVLILNRLSAPRPLYQVTDWLARTVLVYSLGLPAEKFNDDRLGRTLEAIAPHARAIWLDIVQVVMLHFDIDLSVLFYDLTAFVTHGEYKHSQLAEFGFAHNTPMNKRKIKAGLTAAKDGNLPLDYAPWAGSTADTTTVQTNLEHLNQLFQRHGLTATQTVLLVGDRANLNDELALAYDRQPHLKYLAGLEARKKGHRALLRYPDAYFYRCPALDKGYWGLPCQVHFEHQGQHVTHQGLVVLSGPMRSALRQSRAEHFRNLRQELSLVQHKIGQPHYRSAKSVQKHAQTCCRNSLVGTWITVWATETDGQVQLHWAIDRQALLAEMRTDGRYLLVTNDFSLSPAQMFSTYRHKDGVEKCFRVSKQDLKVSPLYLHKDERIQGMLLINMLALLTYRLLERQARRAGLNLTFQRLIARLEDLTVIETYCWDGSVAYRLTPLDEEQHSLLLALADILKQLRWPHMRSTLSAQSVLWLLPEPDPCHRSGVIPELPLG